MGESISPSPQEVAEKSLEEYFNELLPYMIAIGMSYDDFWYKEPSLAKTFLKAHEIRQKQDNEKLWLQGYYNFYAVSTALANAFAKKGASSTPYLKKPLDLGSQDEVEEAKQQQRNNRLLALKSKLLASSKNRRQ